jgi:hypothetical protein
MAPISNAISGPGLAFLPTLVSSQREVLGSKGLVNLGSLEPVSGVLVELPTNPEYDNTL